MPRLVLHLIVIVLVGCHQSGNDLAPKKSLELTPAFAIENSAGIDGPLTTDSVFLRQKVKTIYSKAKKDNYSTKYALLANLGLHSGSKRLYLIDLQSQTIITSGLVTHGSGTTYLPNGQRQYSNTNGSLCSALGLYKIGGHYHGKFGLAYKLYGLNKENSNAFARAIVLHSHSCVPNKETETPICQSWGCPTVSPAFLQTLSTYIDASEKPLLLYLFDSNL